MAPVPVGIGLEVREPVPLRVFDFFVGENVFFMMSEVGVGVGVATRDGVAVTSGVPVGSK